MQARANIERAMHARKYSQQTSTDRTAAMHAEQRVATIGSSQ
jgi:hypothetical protein